MKRHFCAFIGNCAASLQLADGAVSGPVLTCEAVLRRKAEDVQELLDEVRELIGERAIEPYGDWDDPRSVGFRIGGVSATFSIISEERLPERHFSIQIESYPPNDMDYLYTERAVSLWRFLELVKLICGPRDNWPR